MIIKKTPLKTKTKVSPLIGLFLLLIAIILLVLTGILGFIFGIGYTIIKKGMVGLGEFCFEIAKSIDQLGNVLMQHLFNSLFIKKKGYRFGNSDETISSVIGKNQVKESLTGTGNFINGILNIIQQDHSLNSIDYEIENRPNEHELHFTRTTKKTSH